MAVARRKHYSINSVSLPWSIIMHGLMLIFTLICILPVILVLVVSFTSEQDLNTYGYQFFPKAFSLEAYEFLFKTGDQILQSYIISIIVTVGGTLLSLVVMSMFAYTLSRKDFKYGKALSFFTFFTMLFSGGLVPSYMVNTSLLHLDDTIWALILPYTVNAFYVIILRTFFATTISHDIIESAKIDGAREWTIFTRIIVPLSKPDWRQSVCSASLVIGMIGF